jgi:hypothetical protein
MTDKTTPNIMKYVYAWVMIMICINILYTGYVISGGPNPADLTENALYDIFYQEEGAAQTSIGSLSNINNQYDVNDLTSSETQSGNILDALDRLWAFGKWTWFMVQFLTFGGLFTGLAIQNMIENQFLSFLTTGFMTIGNLIFIFLVYKFVMNKGRFD